MRRVSFDNLGTAVATGTVAVLFCALSSASGFAADDSKKGNGKAAGQSKLDLTPDSLSTLLTLGRPHDSEWRHLKVQWLTDVVAARRKAADEDKPIVICYTGGAGYNEPLGVC